MIEIQLNLSEPSGLEAYNVQKSTQECSMTGTRLLGQVTWSMFLIN